MRVGRPRWTSLSTCSTACWTWDARTTSASPEHVGAGGSAAAPLIPAPRWTIGDFLLRLALVVEPMGHRLDVGLRDGAPVLVAEQVFEQHLHGEGQLRNAF